MSRPLPPVRVTGRTAGPKLLLLGDSVGCFIGAALDMHQVQDGVVTLNRARLGCPLLAHRRERSADHTSAPVYRPCIDGQSAAITAFAPDVAVLLVGGPAIDEYDFGNGTWVAPCDAAFTAQYEAGARRTIEALSATGATVVAVTTVHPPKIVDIGAGIVIPAVDGRDVDCENHALRNAVAAEPKARLLDLDGYVCPKGECRTSIDGVALRTDGRHFQGPAANLIAGWLLPRVLALAKLRAHP